MTRQEYFELHKKEQARLQLIVDITSKTLQQFPKNSLGLILDEVKDTQEYKQAKSNFDNAFSDLRNFNTNFVKVFKIELREERKNRFK